MAIDRLVIADYDNLIDTPILNQDLTATFTPVTNTYYRHTGVTGTYTAGCIYYYNGSTYSGIASQTELNNKVTANATITGNTKTKITYDNKGLVTAGTDLAASDIPSLTLSKITDVTATTTEVNVLDGITASTTELNYVDGVTSNIQTQLDSKLVNTVIPTSEIGILTDVSGQTYKACGNVYYTLNTTTNAATVTGALSSIKIATTIYSYVKDTDSKIYKVIGIDGSAFYECSELTGITIPSSVTSIGDLAFSGCSGLTGVTIPGSVTSIDGSAFYNCSGLTSITIPSSVTGIGNEAFYGCSALLTLKIENTSIVIPYTTNMLYNCNHLTKIIVPKNLLAQYKVDSTWVASGFVNKLCSEVTDIDYATTSSKGVLQVGTGLAVTDGVISNAGVTSVNNKTGAASLTYSDVGADVSGAAATVQGNLTTHTGNTSNPHSVTKAQVGLGNVPNTDCTNAGNISSGTLSVAHGGTGQTSLSSVTVGNADQLNIFSSNETFIGSSVDGVAGTNTDVYINYRRMPYGVPSGNTSISEYRFCNSNGSTSGVTLYADNFTGNAATATTATNYSSSGGIATAFSEMEGKANFFYESGSYPINGGVNFDCGLQMRWGTGKITAGETSTSINYYSNFSTRCMSATITQLALSSAIPVNTPSGAYAFATNTLSKTGLAVTIGSAQEKDLTFYYIAIGL